MKRALTVFSVTLLVVVLLALAPNGGREDGKLLAQGFDSAFMVITDNPEDMVQTSLCDDYENSQGVGDCNFFDPRLPDWTPYQAVHTREWVSDDVVSPTSVPGQGAQSGIGYWGWWTWLFDISGPQTESPHTNTSLECSSGGDFPRTKRIFYGDYRTGTVMTWYGCNLDDDCLEYEPDDGIPSEAYPQWHELYTVYPDHDPDGPAGGAPLCYSGYDFFVALVQDEADLNAEDDSTATPGPSPTITPTPTLDPYGVDWTPYLSTNAMYPTCNGQVSAVAVFDHKYPEGSWWRYDSEHYLTAPPPFGFNDWGHPEMLPYTGTESNIPFSGHSGIDTWAWSGSPTGDRGAFSEIRAPVAGTLVRGVSMTFGDGDMCSVRPSGPNEISFYILEDVTTGPASAFYRGRWNFESVGSVVVKDGERVQPGQLLGYVGSGRTSGSEPGPPHLHMSLEPSGAEADGTFWDGFSDPYGWDSDWTGAGSSPLPRADDPWWVASEIQSYRRLVPTTPRFFSCPAPCGETFVVQESEATFAGPRRFIAKPGLLGEHAWMEVATGFELNGSATYTPSEPQPAGRYKVLACTTAQNAAVRVAGRIMWDAMDYFIPSDPPVEGSYDPTAGAGSCIPLGEGYFPDGPSVTIYNGSSLSFPDDGSCVRAAFDEVRFVRMDCPGSGTATATTGAGTATPTMVVYNSPTPLPTVTDTPTPNYTATLTPTSTPTFTITPTHTRPPTAERSKTPTRTRTPTRTANPAVTPTATRTPWGGG